MLTISIEFSSNLARICGIKGLVTIRVYWLTDSIAGNNHPGAVEMVLVMIEYIIGENVVALRPYKNAAHFPALSQVEAYWEALRKGDALPARSDIDPRGMDGALSYAFILERVAPGHARFRIAGMHLTDLMGMEVRGMPLGTFFMPKAREQVSKVLEAVFDTPCVARLRLAGECGRGRPALEAQMLLAPLASDLGDLTRILGCLQSRGDIGRQPRRFDLVDITQRALTPAAAPRPAVPGMAEARHAYDAARQATDAPRPHLRLVRDDES